MEVLGKHFVWVPGGDYIFVRAIIILPTIAHGL
jgi:hypothetical protein